jgi:CBS-domain-containing membrane protein
LRWIKARSAAMPDPGRHLVILKRGDSTMKAGELMTSEVVTVGEDATIADAIRLMLDHRISGLPVVDSANKLRGIVTEGDFLRRDEMGTGRHRPRWLEFLLGSGRQAADYVHSHGRKVAEVMTKPVQTISEDTPVGEIVDLMEHFHIKRVPVVRDGILVGIVGRADLLQPLAHLPDWGPRGVSDAEIRARLTAEIAKQPWAPQATLSVTVEGGVVHLSGMAFDRRECEALRVLAENTPGVTSVEDDLVVIEPLSGVVLEDNPTAARDLGS